MSLKGNFAKKPMELLSNFFVFYFQKYKLSNVPDFVRLLLLTRFSVCRISALLFASIMSKSIDFLLIVTFHFLFQIKQYEKLETVEERMKLAKEIYDNYIMKELLASSHVSFVFKCLFIFLWPSTGKATSVPSFPSWHGVTTLNDEPCRPRYLILPKAHL